MIRLWMIAALCSTGCQLVFELEDSKTVQLQSVLARQGEFTNHLTFERTSDLRSGDLAIAMIQAQGTDDITMIHPGWERIVDEEARACPTGVFYHVWWLRTIVTPETVFDFSFSTQDTMSVLVTTYANAKSARLMELKLFGQIEEDVSTFAADKIASGSVVWIGGGSHTPWGDPNAPSESDPLVSVDNLGAFQVLAPGGDVPEITIATPDEFCAGVAQIKVEP